MRVQGSFVLRGLPVVLLQRERCSSGPVARFTVLMHALGHSQASKAKGSIPLADITAVVRARDCGRVRWPISDSTRCFGIVTERRTYTVYADSVQEAYRWRVDLNCQLVQRRTCSARAPQCKPAAGCSFLVNAQAGLDPISLLTLALCESCCCRGRKRPIASVGCSRAARPCRLRPDMSLADHGASQGARPAQRRLSHGQGRGVASQCRRRLVRHGSGGGGTVAHWSDSGRREQL